MTVVSDVGGVLRRLSSGRGPIGLTKDISQSEPPNRMNPGRSPTETAPSLSDRLAVRAFALYLVIAWLLLVFHWGSGRWFSLDDWVFLTSRDGGDIWSIFQPFGEHLTAMPIIVYRILYNFVGVRYGPYIAVVVTAHLALVVLIRVVMRRLGVDAWIASAVAGMLVLFGAGEGNILWAFQIGFIGSLLFGFAQILLADHEGSPDYRDGIGVLCGVLCICSPGASVIMIGAVGVICLLRRGERAALIHVCPPAVIYLTWYLIMEPGASGGSPRPTLRVSAAWAWHGLTEPTLALSVWRPTASVLGVAVFVGLVVAIAAVGRNSWRVFAVPLVLLLCAPLFYVMVARGRAWAGIFMTRNSRYLYTSAALMLPAMGIATDALIRRWRRATPIVLLIVLIGVPANMIAFDSDPIFNSHFYRNERSVILGVAHSPLLDDATGWVRFAPAVLNGDGLTVQWIREALADGKIPEIGPVDPEISGQFALRLGLPQHPFGEAAPFIVCNSSAGLDVHLELGDRIRIYTDLLVSQIADGQPTSAPVRFRLEDGNGVLSLETTSMDIRLAPEFGQATFTACPYH